MREKKLFFIIIAALFPAFLYLGIIVGLVYYASENIPPEVKSYIQYFLTAGDRKKMLESYIPEEQGKQDILHYNLDIELFPENKFIKGDAVITGISSGYGNILLNFYENMNISFISLNGTEVKRYERNDYGIIIPYPPERDTFSLRIKYSGRPVSAGMAALSFAEHNKDITVYTLNEPIYASTWFPCSDMPSDKALLDISITNDSSRVSVSNGVPAGITSRGRKRTYRWKSLNPVATYLISIYSAKYSIIRDYYINGEGDTLDIFYYAFPGREEEVRADFKKHPDMIRVFSEMFGEYPFMNEKYAVAMFMWNFGGMENQTITGIGERYISGLNFYEDLLIHELAHSWWGNAVTPKSWKDIWLNEGFATYSEALYYEYVFGKDQLPVEMQKFKRVNHKGRLYNPKGDLFSSMIYQKGAWVLHMLRRETGDSLFFSILREYYKQFNHKTASTEDFLNVCKKVSNMNLDEFFRQWVYGYSEKLKIKYKLIRKDDSNYLEIENELKNNFVFTAEFLLEYDDGSKELKEFRIDKNNEVIELGKKRIKQVTADPGNWLYADMKKASEK